MQTQLPDEEQKSRQAILQLGQRALAQLALEAKVAQIQAKQAELELIIEQANQGDLTPLQQWLRIHGPHVTTDVPHFATDVTTPLPAREHLSSDKGLSAVSSNIEAEFSSTDSSLESKADSAQPEQAIRGWNELLPYSLMRLQQLSRSSVPTLPLANSDSPVDSPAEQLLEVVATDDNWSDLAKSKAESKAESQGGRLEQVETVKPISEIIADLGLDQVQLTNTNSATKKGRWRGALLSAIFHLVLVVLLAIVTIENPMKNGLLALVSGGSEGSTEIESFELSQDSQVVEPADASEIVEPTSQTNLAELLPGLSESITQSLSDSLATPHPSETKSSLMSARVGPAKNVMSFYGAESTGNSFCFVLDGSGSMRGGAWEAARQELLKSIGSLKPTQRFYIIFFNRDINAITEPGTNQPASGPLMATSENLNHAKRWLDTLQIATGEPPIKAMELALGIECDCIYFLADGEMTEGVAKRLLDMLRKKNRAMDILDGEVVLSPIHTIAYYSDKGLDIMRKIAEENRGQFAYVPKPKAIRSGK